MRAERCSEGVAICEREVQPVRLWRLEKKGSRGKEALHTRIAQEGEGVTFAVAMSVNF